MFERWRAGCLALALGLLMAACGGGGGSSSPEPAPAPPAPGPGPGPGTVTLAFQLMPSRLDLSEGAEGKLLALQAAGPLTWTSSDPAVASVDGEGQVSAHAAGSVVISAKAAVPGSADAVSTADIRVHAATATSTSSLIRAALSARRISDEQALTYRVYALFGDARLPDEFRGAPDEATDHMLMRRVAAALPTLSPSARETLLPFMVPPIYAQSWYAQRLGVGSAIGSAAVVGKAAQTTQAGRVGGRAAATTRINCDVAALPAFWKKVTTANFNVFYLALGSDAGFDAYHREGALAIAEAAELVYTAETDFFGRKPLSDAGEDCNGGSGLVDIYLTSLGDPTKAGLTQSYPERCNNVPSFVAINANHPAIQAVARGFAEARRDVKGIVAHEFAHVLQLAMDRQGAACNDYEWLDEATAEWAMDFVDRGADREDGFLKASDNRRRSGTFLTQYLAGDHMTPIEQPGAVGEAGFNGYADYIFIQYLARTHDDLVVRRIWDATTTQASVEAVQAALAPLGGMEKVWPAFALTLWNDSSGQVLDDFSRWDHYDWGLADIYRREVALVPRWQPRVEHLRTLEVDQAGQPRASFKLLRNAIEPPGQFPRDNYEIAPRSLLVEHLRFSDANVSSVYFFNPIAALPARRFIKVQAKKKIGGQWREVEDWTDLPYRQFCLDKRDERVEELLIIVSNSEVDRVAEKPFRIPKDFPMQLSTSNVGCWRWLGSASTVLTVTTPGASSERTASGAELLMTVAAVEPGRVVFGPVAGLFTGRQAGVAPGCDITLVGADKEIYRGLGSELLPPTDDGRMEIGLDLDLGLGGVGAEPPDRKLAVLEGVILLTTTHTAVCGPVTVTSVGEEGWDWMRVDTPGSYAVSASGRTISGRYTSASPTGTVNTVWNFSALRQ